MKIEARRNDLRMTLETLNTPTHALLTDQRELVEAALQRAATWFQGEVDRLMAPPSTEPVLDGKGREVGRRITEPNASPLVAHGRRFNPDALHEFRPEVRCPQCKRAAMFIKRAKLANGVERDVWECLECSLHEGLKGLRFYAVESY